jgi:hypothetical protein
MLQTKSFTRSILAFSALCLLSGTFTLAETRSATAYSEAAAPTEPRSEAIDRITDNFFHQANPELNKRKLGSRDRTYIREWKTLRQAIAPMVKTSREVCFRHGNGENYWEFNYNNNSYDDIADVIFYSRNPDLLGQKLSPRSAAAKEWSRIRKPLYMSACGI